MIRRPPRSTPPSDRRQRQMCIRDRNLKGEKFDTELLYWDQNKKRVYSDQRVRIEQPDQIIYAIGFESNEQLTKYRFFKTEGIFYVDEDSVTPSDTLKTDSIK